VGSPNDLYHKPTTKFVAGFIGSPAMNFVPCSLEETTGALSIRLNDSIVLPVPPERTARYRNATGRAKLLLGLRPENITEPHGAPEPGQAPFEVTLEVTEPMGMDTLVHFLVHDTDVCGRVSPNAGAVAGQRMRLIADMNHMHLIDDATGKVL
jgi:multiple sugar transport system ATP-binding protein